MKKITLIRGPHMESKKEYTFLVVIEKAKNNYSAYSPDLLGCVATGKTIDDVKQTMKKAIELHVKLMIEKGLPIPEATKREDFAGVELMDIAV